MERLIYAVNITKGYMVTVDTKTDEQVYRKFPHGLYGPHSIEPDNEGHMWVTMCASGQMAKYDIHNNEFEIYSSAEAPAKRGGYPHTLRINPKDPEGLIWYTDAGQKLRLLDSPEIQESERIPSFKCQPSRRRG